MVQGQVTAIAPPGVGAGASLSPCVLGDWQHACHNFEGSFNCSCGTGYNGSWPACVDIDECAVGNGGCGDATFTDCVNRPGNRLCEDVLECEIDHGGCTPVNHTLCEEVEGGPPNCLDIDECLVESGGCAGGTYCVNRHFQPQDCAPCSAVANADSVRCTEPGNSRARCSPGYYLLDQRALGSSDWCLVCTGQIGCAVDTPSTCLSVGNVARLACTTAEPGYCVVGEGTEATATECEAVANSISVRCADDEPTNSRARCSPGYFVTTCVPGYYIDTCSAGHVRRDQHGSDSSGGIKNRPSGWYLPQRSDTCTECVSQVGCAVDTNETCLTTGNTTYMACTTPQPSHYIVGNGSEATTHPCTSQPNCAVDAAACLTVGDVLLLACATAAPGYYLAGPGTEAEVAECDAVPFADSVLCSEANNSRARCAASYFVTDNSASGVSDVCALCHATQTGCDSSVPGRCLAPGNTPLLACATASPGYWVQGEEENATATLCDVVENAASVTCSWPNNSRAVCLPGFYLIEADPAFHHNTSDTCEACEAVVDAAAVTCTEANNSRASCATGYYVTDFASLSRSDECHLQLCLIGNGGCADACMDMRGGSRACACTSPYYALAADGTSCEDIDECADGNNGGCGAYPPEPIGAGSTMHYPCTNNVGGPPTCVDNFPVCDFEQDRDCDGTCFTPSLWMERLGDGVCDDGSTACIGAECMNFDCGTWYRDNNDCCTWDTLAQVFIC